MLKQSFNFFQISYLSVQLDLRIHECVTYAKILESQPNSHTNICGKNEPVYTADVKLLYGENPFQNAIKRWNFQKPHVPYVRNNLHLYRFVCDEKMSNLSKIFGDTEILSAAVNFYDLSPKETEQKDAENRWSLW